jgi:hypothetical protein
MGACEFGWQGKTTAGSTRNAAAPKLRILRGKKTEKKHFWAQDRLYRDSPGKFRERIGRCRSAIAAG